MPAIVPGRTMIVAEQGPAGKLLELFVERWFSPEGSDEDSVVDRYKGILERAAAVPAGSMGIRFLPWLNGAGPPAQDDRMRGGFFNLSLESEPAHAIRAVMEGVACNLRWLLQPVERMAGRPVNAMNFIGGGARSPEWCQILADVTGRTIRQVEDPNLAIAKGAAYSALLALKHVRLDQIPRLTRIAQEFQPRSGNRAVYDELFQDFQRTFRATRPLFHRWAGRR